MKSWLRRAVAVAVVATVGLVSSVASAAGTSITLIDTGIDMAGSVTAIVLALGGILVVVLGGVFGFMLVKKGIAWIRSIG